MIPSALTALLLGLLLGYRWGKQDGRAVTRRPPPVTLTGGGGSVRVGEVPLDRVASERGLW